MALGRGLTQWAYRLVELIPREHEQPLEQPARTDALEKLNPLGAQG